MSSVSPLSTICLCSLSRNWLSFGARWPSRGRLVSRFEVILSATLGGVLGVLLASAMRCLLRKRFGLLVFCAGIRVLPSCFKRRPCAGRHLLFFAAAKKSRQKKAAHTANSCVCLRAPNRSYASHGNHVTHVRCQRFE